MDNPTQPVASQEPALGNGECLSLALDLTGTVLGDFHVLRRLGEGGMGQVYLAEQRSLKRPIALKILKVDRAENPSSLKRFKTEAEAVARAIHPNIVQVYSIGDQDGLHFMALEYVDGLNLREYLAKKGPPNLSLALSIMRQGAAALQAAAELGIIHRDIKPDNILLTRKGAVKVTDFGLSRFAGDRPSLNLTQSGVAMGTPLYMSPEQVEGKSLDPRTDIYSFGVTCYHMLAGQPPFRGQTAFEVALQHVQADPEPLEKIRPDLPPELCGLIHKMMAKQPDQRFATAREILKELARIRVGLTGSATVSNPLPVDPAVSDLVPTISSPTLSERVAAVSPREGNSRIGKKAGGKQVGLALFTVLLALVGGAWAGWRSSPPPSSATDSDNAKAIEDTETLLRGFQKRRELHLQDAVKVYANPPNGQVHVGLRYHLELGMLYLDQWRLDEANELFLGMMNNPKAVKEYVTIGKLGHAMILAFPRDNTSLGEKYEESTQLFLELVRTKDKGLAKLHWLINRHPGFLQMLTRALEYDAANYKAANLPFPKELEDYRKTRPLPQKLNQPKSGGANAKKT